MRRIFSGALCALAVVACGGAEESGDEEAADQSIESGTPHVLPYGRSETARTGAQLKYYGGPVVESAKVVAVLWGSSVDADVAGRIGDFYKAVVASSYFDWLSEYDPPGKKQHIGRGSLAGVFRIAPARKGQSLSDKEIEKELAAQIRARKLPAADANAIYLIHFPPGVRISLGGSTSCQPGGFCGYHSTFRTAGAHVRYSVLPDMGAGSGCDTGCGNAGSPFARVTSVASHELVEATTDPDVGLAKSLGAPLAWYDAQNGEIGDICNGRDGQLRAGGAIWTVQKQWSNKARACVLH
jgi:hypothetical protein